jgi:hypothetical protein
MDVSFGHQLYGTQGEGFEDIQIDPPVEMKEVPPNREGLKVSEMTREQKD